MDKKDNIFVAGHNGLVGSSIVRKLKMLGFDNILTHTRKELDLMNSNQVEHFFKNNNGATASLISTGVPFTPEG